MGLRRLPKVTADIHYGVARLFAAAFGYPEEEYEEHSVMNNLDRHRTVTGKSATICPIRIEDAEVDVR